MSKMNRLANCKNQYQMNYKKVLCVCSAGLLRSPTTALVLSKPPFNYNTRAAGISDEYALIPVDDVLLEWADEIVCMEKSHEVEIRDRLDKAGSPRKPLICLDLPDDFSYRDHKLMKMIAEKYTEKTAPSKN